MPLYVPPSLDPIVIRRSWIASNGEIGVLPQDVDAFLDACERDQTRMFGWEMWLVDHQWDGGDGARDSKGSWTGLIPDAAGGTCFWVGDGDLESTRADFADLQWEHRVPPELHANVRFNFTIDL